MAPAKGELPKESGSQSPYRPPLTHRPPGPQDGGGVGTRVVVTEGNESGKGSPA
jgi:hypothetical protein